MKFTHTNIIANDWKKLAQFYQNVFSCEPLYPERDLKGEWIDQATAMRNTHIKGIHLRLPGYGDNGPTLEIFQYHKTDNAPKHINSSGFSHIAFLVDDVKDVVEKLRQNGGSLLGEMVVKEIPSVGILTFNYAKDPEGNIVEIQNWK